MVCCLTLMSPIPLLAQLDSRPSLYLCYAVSTAIWGQSSRDARCHLPDVQARIERGETHRYFDFVHVHCVRLTPQDDSM